MRSGWTRMTLALIDTNILVYAHDPSDPEKQDAAIAVIDRTVELESGCLSVQCLAELFCVLTRGADPLMTSRQAEAQLARLARAMPVFPLTPMIVREAARGVCDHRFSYWDAQIWASARLNQVPIILTEDHGPRREIEGVEFIDPFHPGFDVDILT